MKVPYLQQAFYFHETAVQITSGTPIQSSYIYPLSIDSFYWVNNYGFDNIGTKAWEMFVVHATYLFLKQNVHPEDKLHSSLQGGWINEVGKGVIFGTGIEGLRDRSQRPDNQATFYPAVPSLSKFNPDFTDTKMELEFVEFIEKYDKIVLVSFGTMFVPLKDHMDLLIASLKLTDSSKTGIIISLKEYAPSYEELQ